MADETTFLREKVQELQAQLAAEQARCRALEGALIRAREFIDGELQIVKPLDPPVPPKSE